MEYFRKEDSANDSKWLRGECVCEEHFSENSDYNDEDVHVPPVQENGNRN